MNTAASPVLYKRENASTEKEADINKHVADFNGKENLLIPYDLKVARQNY